MKFISGKELIKILQRHGWVIASTEGSHYKLKKGNKSVVLPYHNKDLKPGILAFLLKQTDLKQSDL
ncbi:MAG: type II toxin-antitoxin system HicA family toxin [Candidatus Caenarcaniphilales bacterium]|nr:type II toxin-antitoxin system HicA family toxin [Candidatus Caenarcaniphilales bacterium]